MKEVSCSKCWYSHKQHDGSLVCRKNAPFLTLAVTTEPYSDGHRRTRKACWPEVNYEEWCGDFLDKEEGDKTGQHDETF